MTLRLKLDENLPRSARAPLEALGWDVHDVHDEGLGAAPDREVQDACEREGRILLTLDTDFSDVRRYGGMYKPGVIILRPRDQSIPQILTCLEGAIRVLALESVVGSLWVVYPDRVRIRAIGS